MDFKIKKENTKEHPPQCIIPTLLFSTDVPIAKISSYLTTGKSILINITNLDLIKFSPTFLKV